MELTLFPIVKWLHILAAIAAVGTNMTYGVWLARAARQPDMLPFTLKTVKLLDDRLANPCYGLLLVTGLTMVFVVPFSITTPWILTALILYGVLALLAIFGYTPTLRKQIQLLESGGPNSPDYQAAAKRGMVLGIVLAVITVTIIFLMVVKPPLWSTV
jgi:uncharacterized membrane protein